MWRNRSNSRGASAGAANSTLLSFKIPRQILIQLFAILQGGNTLIMLVCCYPADGKYGGKAARQVVLCATCVGSHTSTRSGRGRGRDVMEGIRFGKRERNMMNSRGRYGTRYLVFALGRCARSWALSVVFGEFLLFLRIVHRLLQLAREVFESTLSGINEKGDMMAETYHLQ